MGRHLKYKPGSFYQTDDRTGFVQRVDRTKKEWDGLIVDRTVWEPRQPQDLVRGVRDNQNVDNARPLGPNVFVGPVETTLSQTALVGSYIVYLSSTYSIRATDRVSIMLDNGVPFLVYVAAVLNGFIVIGNPLPYQASSGNVFYDYGYGFPGPTGLANDGGVVQLLDASGYPSSFSGLPAGALWNNGGVVGIVSGSTPNPLAAEVFFGLIAADQLLHLGGGNLPTSSPAITGSNQLWNNGGEVSIA